MSLTSPWLGYRWRPRPNVSSPPLRPNSGQAAFHPLRTSNPIHCPRATWPHLITDSTTQRMRDPPGPCPVRCQCEAQFPPFVALLHLTEDVIPESKCHVRRVSRRPSAGTVCPSSHASGCDRSQHRQRQGPGPPERIDKRHHEPPAQPGHEPAGNAPKSSPTVAPSGNNSRSFAGAFSTSSNSALCSLSMTIRSGGTTEAGRRRRRHGPRERTHLSRPAA